MTLKNLPKTLFLAGVLFVLWGCSKSDDQGPCGSSSTSVSADNICLLIEHPGLSAQDKTTIETEVTAGIAAITGLMPINNLLIRIVQDQNLVIPEIGVGGFNPDAEEVIIAIDANFSDLEGALEESLPLILAHEVHHAKRRRSVGYGNTLLQAAVSEGLADHFSLEVTGMAPPPWSVALSGQELQDWIDTASQSWNEPTYNHFAWFVGADPGIPRWTGYSIGFELVNNYLSAHPGEKPSSLHDEPANSFLP